MMNMSRLKNVTVLTLQYIVGRIALGAYDVCVVDKSLSERVDAVDRTLESEARCDVADIGHIRMYLR